MKLKDQSSLETKGFLLLLKGSLSSIPFNVVLATILGVDFIFNQVPVMVVGFWLAAIFLVSSVRWFNSHVVIKQEYYLTRFNASLWCFLSLTFLMGLVWGASYFIFLPYVNHLHEAIIMLVLGGMSAGAIASLSVYLPAYFAYVLPMFLPVIIYNFSRLSSERKN